MRQLLALVTLLLVGAGCGSDDEYQNHDLTLVTSYAAQEMCSCLFVMGQSEDFCVRFTRANPNVKTVRVDRAGKKVQAQAVVFFGATARYTGPRFGCVLE